MASFLTRGEDALGARGEENDEQAAPEYRPDGRFMAFVREMEQTGEGVDDDPTPEILRRHAARRGML